MHNNTNFIPPQRNDRVGQRSKVLENCPTSAPPRSTASQMSVCEMSDLRGRKRSAREGRSVSLLCPEICTWTGLDREAAVTSRQLIILVPGGFGVTAMTITVSKVLIGLFACSGNHHWPHSEKKQAKATPCNTVGWAFTTQLRSEQELTSKSRFTEGTLLHKYQSLPIKS